MNEETLLTQGYLEQGWGVSQKWIDMLKEWLSKFIANTESPQQQIIFSSLFDIFYSDDPTDINNVNKCLSTCSASIQQLQDWLCEYFDSRNEDDEPWDLETCCIFSLLQLCKINMIMLNEIFNEYTFENRLDIETQYRYTFPYKEDIFKTFDDIYSKLSYVYVE